MMIDSYKQRCTREKTFDNCELFRIARILGYDYILNTVTGELHNVNSDCVGSHNLHRANFTKFVGVKNIGIPIHKFREGTLVKTYDLLTGAFLGNYALNRCKHCQWDMD